MVTFSELRRQLQATWPEQPERVRVLAARFYLGVETVDDLQFHTERHECYSGSYAGREVYLGPLLSLQEARMIVSRR